MAETEVDVAGPLTLEEAKAVGDVPEDFGRKPSLMEKATALITGKKEESSQEAAPVADNTEKRVSFVEDQVQQPPEEKPKQKSFLGFLSRRKSETATNQAEAVPAAEESAPAAAAEAVAAEEKTKSKSKSFLENIFHKGSKDLTAAEEKPEVAAVAEEATTAEDKRPSYADVAFASGVAAVAGAGVAGGAVAANAAEEQEEAPATANAVATGDTAAADAIAASDKEAVGGQPEETVNLPEGVTVVKQGTSQKQSRFCKRWRLRHIRLLSDATMQYSKTEDFKSVKGMSLANTEVSSSTGKAPANFILSIRGAKSMVLGFADEAERHAWANVVNDIKARAFAAERSNAEDGQEQVLKTSQVEEKDAAGTGEVPLPEQPQGE